MYDPTTLCSVVFGVNATALACGAVLTAAIAAVGYYLGHRTASNRNQDKKEEK